MKRYGKGYAIRCYKNTKQGFIVETLGQDSQWYIACNNASFSSLKIAREFFKTATYELRGSDMWIEGPRGGRHSLFDRG